MKPSETPDAEEPLDPAAMAAVMQAQQNSFERRESRGTAVIVGIWGIVWLVGYLAVWSGADVGGNPWFRLPSAVHWWVLGVLILVGVIVSAVAGARLGSGRRGPTARSDKWFGLSFGVGSVAIFFFDAAMVRSGLTPEQASLLFPASFTFLIGAMYMAGAGANRSRAMFVAGAVLLVLTVIATYVGAPHHLLVYAAAGLVFLTSSALIASGRIR